MAGVNDRTIWTWNAIGKRKGAWQLDEDAPEANSIFAGPFHLTVAAPQRGRSALLQLRPDHGARPRLIYVRIAKAAADEPAESAPQFESLPRDERHGRSRTRRFDMD